MDYTNELRAYTPVSKKNKVMSSFIWCMNVINSCTNTEHINYCDKIVHAFYMLHGAGDLANELTAALCEKHELVRIDIP